MPLRAPMTLPQISRRRVLTVHLFEIVALWGIAVVQPLLGVFGSSAETFIANGIAPHTILPIVIGFCIIPPLFLCGLELLLLKLPTLLAWFHRVVIAAFFFVFFAQIFKVSFELKGVILSIVVIVATALGVTAFHKVSFIGQWFRFLSMTPFLALALFAFNTPSGRYALNSSGEVHENLTTDGSSLTVVMFDEFALETIINADGELDRARFPNFYRLSQMSTWYRNYSTTAEGTIFAVPAALSGKLPDFSKGPTVADYPHTVFTWLGDSYRMNVSETMTSLCPQRLCKKLSSRVTPSFLSRLGALGSDALDVLRQRVDPTKEITVATSISGAALDYVATSSTSEKSATPDKQAIPEKLTTTQRLAATRAQTKRWDSWLTNVRAEGCPCLNYIHMLLPHHPWVFFPDGTTYTTNDPGQTIDETSWENLVRRQRHALQAQYADKLIGDLLNKLESEGMLEDTEIVVMADHGVSFQDGYYRRIVVNDYANYPSIVYPPLFVHRPGQMSSEISDVNMESEDLVSVIADGIGSSWPWETDGSLPARRTGERLTKKTLYLQPGNAILVKRPDKQLVVDADEAQKKMFSRAHSELSTDDYLEPLYRGTPHDALRGTAVQGGLLACSCTLTLSDDSRELPIKLYVTGEITGDAREGDWFVFAVDGKISGMSPVYTRGGKLRIVALLKSEDFASPNSAISAYRIPAGANTLQEAEIK